MQKNMLKNKSCLTVMIIWSLTEYTFEVSVNYSQDEVSVNYPQEEVSVNYPQDEVSANYPQDDDAATHWYYDEI